jgi:hypothetical protein
LNFTEGIVVSRISGYADVLSAVINDNIANQISITLTPRIKKKLAQDVDSGSRIIVLDDVSDLFVGGQIKIDPQTPLLEEARIIQAIDLDTKTIVLNAGLTYSHSADAPVWFIGPSGAGTTKYVDSLQENISTTLQRIVVDRTGGLVVGNELLIGDEVVEIDGFNGTYGISLRDINNVVGSAILRAVYPSGTKVDRVFRQSTYTSSATSQTLASTTLASPAAAGSRTIKVNSLLNISVSDRIVIEGENAVFTVQSIDSTSNTIVLNANLSSSHPAGEKVYEVEADDPSAADSNDADAVCNTTIASPGAFSGGTTIPVSDVSDVQVGDFLLLQNAAGFQEVVKVVGVSGNTVYVSKPIFGNYASGNSVREVVLVKDTRVNVKLLAAYPMIQVGNANQLKINGTVRIDDGTLTQDAIVKSIIDDVLLGLGGRFFISVVPSGNVFSKDFPQFRSKVTSSDVREADILSVDVKDTSGNSSTTVDINSNGKPENKLRGDGQVVE